MRKTKPTFQEWIDRMSYDETKDRREEYAASRISTGSTLDDLTEDSFLAYLREEYDLIEDEQEDD